MSADQAVCDRNLLYRNLLAEKGVGAVHRIDRRHHSAEDNTTGEVGGGHQRLQNGRRIGHTNPQAQQQHQASYERNPTHSGFKRGAKGLLALGIVGGFATDYPGPSLREVLSIFKDVSRLPSAQLDLCADPGLIGCGRLGN